MSRDDVIRMAREVGMSAHCGIVQDGKHVPAVAALKSSVPVEWLERFAALVAASEREACALVAQWTPDAMGVSQKIASSIRARSAV